MTCAKLKAAAPLGVALISLFLSACSNPVNLYTATNYTQLARESEAAGDLAGARVRYARAVINTRIGHAPPEMQADALYEWARVSGYLGYYADANKAYDNVLALIAQAQGRADSLRAPTYCEQARLLRDSGHDRESIPVYAKAVAELERVGADKTHAVAFAGFLDDYAQALRSTGAKDQADRTAARIRAIRSEQSAGKSQTLMANFRAAGRAAQNRDDWHAAKLNWWRALTAEEANQTKPADMAVSYYEYGRSAGVLGEFPTGEEYLKKALIADRAGGNDGSIDLVELARLNYDQGNFAEASAYYDQVVPLLEAANAGQDAPAAFVDILTEYADSLHRTARATDARKVEHRIVEIKTAHPELHSITERTPYGKNPRPRLPAPEGQPNL